MELQNCNHVTLKHYRKTIRCKFNEEGRCKNKMWCEFKHLINTPCKYYQKGNCMRGDMCNYRHIGQKRTPHRRKQRKKITNQHKVSKKSPSGKVKLSMKIYPNRKQMKKQTYRRNKIFRKKK